MIRKTISMPDDMGEWINQHIAGNFNNESEYFRHLVRLDQERQDEIIKLRRLLKASEASGISEYTIPDIMKRVQKRMAENGQLPTDQ